MEFHLLLLWIPLKYNNNLTYIIQAKYCLLVKTQAVPTTVIVCDQGYNIIIKTGLEKKYMIETGRKTINEWVMFYYYYEARLFITPSANNLLLL